MKYLLLLLLTVSASAQIIVLQGGTSTLISGTGAQAQVYLPSSMVTGGLGVEQGRFVFAASDAISFHTDDTLIVGSQNFGDAVNASGIGIGLRKDTKSSTIGIFAGISGPVTPQPFFAGYALDSHLAGALYYRWRSQRWTVSSLALVAGNQKNLLQGASYSRSKLKLTGQGGLLNNLPSAAGYALYTPNTHVAFMGSRQDSYDYLSTVASSNLLHTTSESIGTTARISHFTTQAAIIQTTAASIQSSGETFGLGFNSKRASVNANYFRQKDHSLETYLVRESVIRHLELTQTLTQQSGNLSLSFGGEYRCNRFSVDVAQQEVYVPYSGIGWQRSTVVSVSMRFHSALVTVANAVTPTGSSRYSVYASDYTNGPMHATEAVSRTTSQGAGGHFIVSATVVNGKTQQPVAGIAVQMGRAVIFSDSRGNVFVRTKNTKPIALKVLLDESAAVGQWKLTSCPDSAIPRAEKQAASVLVITVETF